MVESAESDRESRDEGETEEEGEDEKEDGGRTKSHCRKERR